MGGMVHLGPHYHTHFSGLVLFPLPYRMIIQLLLWVLLALHLGSFQVVLKRMMTYKILPWHDILSMLRVEQFYQNTFMEMIMSVKLFTVSPTFSHSFHFPWFQLFPVTHSPEAQMIPLLTCFQGLSSSLPLRRTPHLISPHRHFIITRRVSTVH